MHRLSFCVSSKLYTSLKKGGADRMETRETERIRFDARRRRRKAARCRRAAALLLVALIIAVTAFTIRVLTPPKRESGKERGQEKPQAAGGESVAGTKGDGDAGETGGAGTAPEGDEYAEMLALVAEKNPEAMEFVENYEGSKEPDTELELTVTGGGEIPCLTQWDSRWGYMVYGAGLMGWTGCGPTALSMVAIGLTGDGTLTPAYVADFAVREGYCEEGNGTAWTLFSDGAEELGLTARELPLWEPTVDAELDAGRPIICIMGPGHFTDEGHYIVLTGHTDDDYSVLDPFRPSNCHEWAWEDFAGEIRNLWSYKANR